VQVAPLEGLLGRRDVRLLEMNEMLGWHGVQGTLLAGGVHSKLLGQLSL
jgi:hypothetical protein